MYDEQNILTNEVDLFCSLIKLFSDALWPIMNSILIKSHTNVIKEFIKILLNCVNGTIVIRTEIYAIIIFVSLFSV